MTIKNRFPDVAPTLNLDFANSKRLDPRITFTRASTGTYVDELGIIRTAAANQARFDHDGSGNSLGLLIEEARTNLITYSEDFTQSSVWGLLDATVVPNSALSPRNNFDATLLRENATLAYHGIRYPVTVGTGGTTTLSFFVKYVSKQFVQVTTDYSDMGTWNIDLLNLTANQVSGAASSVTLQQVASGWIQIRFTYTWNANNRWPNILLSSSLSMSRFGSYAGDGTSGIYIWGAQLETGSFPTSYIPTSGSTATRSADVANMTGTNFSSWYNSSKSSFDVAFSSQFGSAQIAVAALSDGTTSNRISFRPRNTIVTSSGVGQFNLGLTTGQTPANEQYRLGLSVDSSGAFLTNKYGSASYTSAVTMPVGINQLELGRVEPAGSIFLNGHIARLTYYDRRLTDAQLQALTL